MDRFERELLTHFRENGIGPTLTKIKLLLTNHCRVGADLTTPYNKRILNVGYALADAARTFEDMKILDSHWDFYNKLSEDERKALIGKCFREKDREAFYFPVGLADGEFNYGVQQGLIFVTPIMNRQKKEKWFRVGASSPDDLDIDLDFFAPFMSLHQDVIEFVRTAKKKNVTYRGFLKAIQDHFKAGEMTS